MFGTATLILHDRALHQVEADDLFLAAGRRFPRQHLDRRAAPGAALLRRRARQGDRRDRAAQWLRINWLWVAFYAALGALNLFGGASQCERRTGSISSIGLTVATLVFIVAQFAWLLGAAAPRTHDMSCRRADRAHSPGAASSISLRFSLRSRTTAPRMPGTPARAKVGTSGLR